MSHGYGFSLECILIYVYLRPFHIYHKNTFFMCGSFSGQILTNYFRKIISLILIYILHQLQQYSYQAFYCYLEGEGGLLSKKFIE